jgi:transposase
MPQLQLPIFPAGSILINRQVAFDRKDDRIYYFHGLLPVFSHAIHDLKSFRYITSQLVIGGNVSQTEIVKAFGVSRISVKRYVKLLREHGSEGFFKVKKGRSEHILTPEVVETVQRLLYEGENVSEIAKRLDIKVDTIRKAISSGRLHKKKVKRAQKK